VETKKNPLENILGIFNKLSMQQRLLIGGIAVVSIVVLGFVLFSFNEPDYAALFTNMAPEDASKVVESLTSSKTPYKIEDNGSTIRIPKDKVYETRLSLASKGIPSSGIVGYEIFDKSTMGMSEFMQKLNYKRALEGELSRTIMQIDEVAGARIQIVVPQKTVFKEEEKEPTASVIIKLKGRSTLSEANINAIANLISSSVEGMRPGKVTILDTQGRLLSKELDEGPAARSSSKQYEIKQNIESYLSQKAQSILDNVVGYGNAMVQVNADIDFDQVEKTMELYDPESQVAVSEQNIKGENSGKTSGDSTTANNENSTTNYEISKTLQKVIAGTGNIKRLSVAAVINDIPSTVKNGDNIKTVFKTRSEDQIRKLEEILKNAVGIDPQRRDQFSIVSMPFETTKEDGQEESGIASILNNEKYTNYILLFVAVGAAMFILKGLMGRLKNEKILIGKVNSPALASSAGQDDDLFFVPPQQQLGGSERPSAALPPKKKKAILEVGDIEDEITDEAVQKKVQQEKIVNYVQKNPVDAAKLINAWLHEDEY
jgi:flagellar M-ring protein FliF